jgi:hypothetical protein
VGGWLYLDYAGVERGPFATFGECEKAAKLGRRKEKPYPPASTFSIQERSRG